MSDSSGNLYSVKPLHWEYKGWGYIAKAFNVTYAITEGQAEMWCPTERTLRFPGVHSVDECKAICQSHFEQHILGQFLVAVDELIHVASALGATDAEIEDACGVSEH